MWTCLKETEENSHLETEAIKPSAMHCLLSVVLTSGLHLLAVTQMTFNGDP